MEDIESFDNRNSRLLVTDCDFFPVSKILYHCINNYNSVNHFFIYEVTKNINAFIDEFCYFTYTGEKADKLKKKYKEYNPNINFLYLLKLHKFYIKLTKNEFKMFFIENNNNKINIEQQNILNLKKMYEIINTEIDTYYPTSSNKNVEISLKNMYSINQDDVYIDMINIIHGLCNNINNNFNINNGNKNIPLSYMLNKINKPQHETNRDKSIKDVIGKLDIKLINKDENSLNNYVNILKTII